MRLYAGHKLRRTERFRDVVVSARIEHLDGNTLIVTRREHDDWHTRLVAQSATQVHTIDIRKPEVEHDELRGIPSDSIERVGGIARSSP